METFNAYIDGFSLYKGVLENRPDLKWLNLQTFCQSKFPNLKLHNIYYFTARIKSRFPGDSANVRQHKYLRVLKDQGIQIVEGKFFKDTDWLRLASKEKSKLVQPELPNHFGITQFGLNRIFKKTHPDSPKSFVWKYGEKGSDVNLASYLLRDIYANDLKHALVISGDSDLTTPIKLAEEHGAKVFTIHPKKGAGSAELRLVSTFFEELHPNWLREHQLPRSFITKNGGNIVRPHEWQESKNPA